VLVPDEWVWNDGWILTAVVLSHRQGGSDLASVIGASDYINRLIPTSAEVISAVNRLRAGRLLDDNDPFLPTELAESLFDRVATTGLLHKSRGLVELLNQQVPRTDVGPAWTITEADYDDAERVYRRRVQDGQYGGGR
jgi:hypothetical protein